VQAGPNRYGHSDRVERHMLPELSTGPIRVSPLAASACACSALTDKRCRRADNFSDVWRDPPPGADRTYVRVQGPLSVASWLAGIKAGHTFGSTGPILLLTVNRHQQGDEIKLAADAKATLPVHVEAFSIAPLDRLDIIVNGAVAHSVRITDPAHVIVDQPIAVPEGGWIAARVVGPSSRYVTDSYAFAQTSPVYVVRGGRVYRSAADAKFLADVVEAIGARVEERSRWRTPAEHDRFTAALAQARAVYLRLAQQAADTASVSANIK
jgi:hypothetical protein